MDLLSDLKHNLGIVEEKIGRVFVNKEWLILAFVHRSYANEHKGAVREHNERLEFLGDSVLGLCIADYLYRRLPHYPEGALSQLRSQLVDAGACAKYCQKLNLGPHILLGRGEQMTEGKMKPSILADVFEALIGALFLDGGLHAVLSFLLAHFEREMEEAIGSPSRNFKAELQDLVQKQRQKPPVYKVIEESGPDHAKQFHVMVCVNDVEMGLGLGASKKEAEQRAAFEALSKLGPNTIYEK
ncbi:MAG: ribonuclease [Chlamydiota bacterium]